MGEFRLEGSDAILITATLDQRQQLENQANQLAAAIEQRFRELNSDLPPTFTIRVEPGAAIAVWEEPDEAD